MTPYLKKLLSMSMVMVITMYALLITGVLTIESAARHLTGGGELYAGKQTTWILIGSVVYFATALFDYKWIKYLAVPMYFGSLILMLLAHVFGNKVHQLTVGPLSFQPAQFALVAGFIAIAWIVQSMGKWHEIFKLDIVRVLMVIVIAFIPFGLVAAMGDMGSALVWMPMVGVVMLVSGVAFRYLLSISLVGLALLPILFFVVLPSLSPRGTERIETFLDMLNERKVDILGDAYGPYHAGMAVGKSGYKGVGLNADTSKGSLHARRYIPVKTAHNDYIFAVFAEEQGFLGSIFLLMAFSLLLIQSIFVGYYSRDMAGQIICGAVVAIFFAHIFENVGMCIWMMPVTGIPLPLISYSGTFVLMCMFMLGLVQSVWVHRRWDLEEDKKPARISSRGKKQQIGRRREFERVNPNVTY